MRQAGVIAAAALFALEHHVERLADDHAHAKILAEAVRSCPKFQLRPEKIDTNIVIFHVDPSLGTAADVVAQMKNEGVWMYAIGPQSIRAVTHLDVSRSDIERAAEIVHRLAGS